MSYQPGMPVLLSHFHRGAVLPDPWQAKEFGAMLSVKSARLFRLI
jgi:hypothetical protein